MSGSNLQGRWMPSSVMEEDVLKLREAKYLAYEISHRLPAEGQAIPTPEPGEYVVFVSHLRRGLGFPTDPFVRGIMFYYGLDFTTWLRSPSSISPHSSLSGKPSSASPPTSACG